MKSLRNATIVVETTQVKAGMTKMHCTATHTATRINTRLNNSIFIDKTAIDQVFTIKFLGVFIDTHLNWSHHISKLIESMRPIAGLFFRLSNHIPRKVLTVLYYSLIHSKISQ